MTNIAPRQPVIDVLLEAYRIAEENHRFYVDKRFAIISFYLPMATAVFSAGYFVLPCLERLAVALLATAVTLFLYALENRNWILSNECLKSTQQISAEIAVRTDEALRPLLDLHECLGRSHSSKLPGGRTWLDPIMRGIARSQHKAVCWLTVLLFCYWIVLAALALCQVACLGVGNACGGWCLVCRPAA